MFKVVRKEFQYGKERCVFETGRIARQATAAVLVTLGDATVLVTVVGKKEEDSVRDFFPLTVNYQEKTYAAGRIPGGFFKREGRPSEKEILTSRLIDRPIRPLFPKGFNSDVQVIATVLSTGKLADPDIAAMLGASAALSISGMPFNGPLGAARVGYVDGAYVLNPNYKELEQSELDLVVAGTEAAVMMVESQAKELSEDEMLGAVLYGHQEMQVVVTAIREFAAEVAVSNWDWQPVKEDQDLKRHVGRGCFAALTDAYQIKDKQERHLVVDKIRDDLIAKLIPDETNPDVESNPEFTKEGILETFHALERQIVRESILSGKPRIDGRDKNTVRPIDIQVGVLPETHGSALFTRGETQAIAVVTLGGAKEGQMIDALEGVRTERFMLHYNFPPFCVGETGMVGAPKRREIGHGYLARRAVNSVLPEEQDFPYVMRVVAEITESNGSSSMATVCGSSLALMDAGVDIKAPVAGIAMGLVKEGDRFVVLSDILGDEDHLGDMDFKVAGTAQGITALQMDIKTEGIDEAIMETALNQALEGRQHILEQMNQVIATARKELHPRAPRFVTHKIDPERIRDVIGKGGATVRALCESTNTTIDIDDDGLIRIYSEDQSSCEAALAQIEALTAVPEVGKVYQGKVVRVVDFGAFVNFLPNMDGLVHISQIANTRIERVSDYVQEGQEVQVKVIEIDDRGRVKLSMKAVME